MDLQTPLANLSSTQKDQLMTEVKQQIAVANAQELVTVSPNKLQNPILSVILNRFGVSENHREMLSKMCVKAWHELRRFGTKMHCNVHGSFYGFVESSFANVRSEDTTGTERWWRFLSGQMRSKDDKSQISIQPYENVSTAIVE